MLLNFACLLLAISYTHTYNIFNLLISSRYTETLLGGDVYSRLDMNLFFSDALHFSWTHISYLFFIMPVFLFTYFYTKLYYQINVTQILFSSFIFCVLGYILTSQCYLDSPLSYITVKLCSYNPLLINSLNRYHPFILYLSWLFVPLGLATKLSNKALYTANLTRLYDLYTYIVCLAIFTLFMGSWWAYQEGSWGGWWNWDPSEVFGILILFCTLIILHSYLLKIYKNNLSTIISLLMYSTLLYYSFMQANFTLISHNFGFRDNDLLDVKNFYIFLIFFAIQQLYYVLGRVLTTYANNKSAIGTISYQWYKFITMLFYTFIVISPLLYLVNDFIWKLLQLNISNLSFTYSWVTLSTALLYMLFYSNSTLYIVLFLALVPIFSFSQYWYLYLMSYPLLINLKFRHLHYFVLILFLYNTEYYSYLLSLWYLNGSSQLLYACDSALNNWAYTTVSYPYTNSSCLTSSLSDTCVSYLYFTSPDTKHFNLSQAYHYSAQTFLSDYNFTKYALSTNEYILNFVMSVLLYILWLYYSSIPKFITVL
jgi:cytochrome c biogenesis factor